MKRNIDRWRSTKNVTHLLLDGGTLSAKEGFYEAYIQDLLNFEKLFVVEKKTQQFRFFVDLDYVGENELDFERVCKEIFSVVKLGPCVIAKADPRTVSSSKGTKYGVHMIWPESVVDKPLANSIRMRILDEFGSGWEKIIDASVYSGSGLRMLWSYKNEPGSTWYVPWAKIDESGDFVFYKDQNPSVNFLKIFSIRTSEHVTLPKEQRNDDLENFIRTNIPGQEKASISRIEKCKKKENGLWVSTNSRYCENIKREHKSNHVWFNVKKHSEGWHMIAQKCQDEECKGYTGRFYRFPSRLIPNERILDVSNHRVISDYFPDGWRK